MFAQASFPWLFGQEMRIIWRGSLLVRSRRYVLVPVIVVGLVFQGVALLVADVIVKHQIGLPEMILVANLNLFFFGFLMLSRAMTAAIDVLYARGDVDFLLASPIPPGRVLAVRMIGVAASVAAPWLLLGGVLANALAVFGEVWALAIYPVLLAVGLVASALAFALVVLLVGRFGPGRARAIGHVVALLTGVLIFALGQAPRFIEPARMARLWRAFMPNADIAAPQWIPGRALLGAPVPLLLFLAFAAAMFGLVWLTLDGKFATGAIGAAAYRPDSSPRRTGQFRATPFAAAMLKNLRLLTRFPGLVTQTVYRALTLVPVLMILSGGVEIGAGPEVVAPLLVFLAGQLALFFISVIIGTDQSPELAVSAPASDGGLRRAALAAAGYAACVIMALPVIGVAWREPVLLPVVVAGIVGVVVSNLVLGARLPIPLVRAEFGKSATGTVMGLILGVAVSSAWGLAAWLAVTPHPFAWLVHT
jgi:ABC-2 type transport system permease protein